MLQGAEERFSNDLSRFGHQYLCEAQKGSVLADSARICRQYCNRVTVRQASLRRRLIGLDLKTNSPPSVEDAMRQERVAKLPNMPSDLPPSVIYTTDGIAGCEWQWRLVEEYAEVCAGHGIRVEHRVKVQSVIPKGLKRR